MIIKRGDDNMNKTWLIAESRGGLCDIEESNCHLCGNCYEEEEE